MTRQNKAPPAKTPVHLLPLQPEGWFKEPGKTYIPLKECTEARLSNEPFDSFIERKNREAAAKPKIPRSRLKKQEVHLQVP
jgi:hypothetical protein